MPQQVKARVTKPDDLRSCFFNLSSDFHMHTMAGECFLLCHIQRGSRDGPDLGSKGRRKDKLRLNSLEDFNLGSALRMYRLDVSVAVPLFLSPGPFCDDLPGHFAGSKMSTEAQRVDDSPSTSGGSSDGDQRESVQQEPEREQVQPKKKEGKLSSKTAAKLSTSAKRIQKELAEITLDPPPNCSSSANTAQPQHSQSLSQRNNTATAQPWHNTATVKAAATAQPEPEPEPQHSTATATAQHSPSPSIATAQP
ncbi:ubiquitin-conjugating enzyme E2 E2-like protein [Cricetulus griseus]|nr:ubiquitin-conjugating enzyme E2 E2-like protein [Cricetulus griseus]